MLIHGGRRGDCRSGPTVFRTLIRIILLLRMMRRRRRRGYRDAIPFGPCQFINARREWMCRTLIPPSLFDPGTIHFTRRGNGSRIIERGGVLLGIPRRMIRRGHVYTACARPRCGTLNAGPSDRAARSRALSPASPISSSSTGPPPARHMHPRRPIRHSPHHPHRSHCA